MRLAKLLHQIAAIRRPRLATVALLPLLFFVCTQLGYTQSSKSRVLPAVKDATTIEKSITISGFEVLGGKRLRLYFGATEATGSVPYPITTIDRSSVKVNFVNVSAPPVEPTSLAVSGSQPGDIKRALFVAFNLDRNLTGRELSEVRTRVGEIVEQLPSDFLSVAAMAKGSARQIIDSSPEQSDNTNKIDQLLAALPAEGDGSSMTDILCVGAEKFSAWDTSSFRDFDQRIVLVLSPPEALSASDRIRFGNCIKSLIEQKVRIIHISFAGTPAADSSLEIERNSFDRQGYVHHVKGPIDILAAVKNAISLLKNEYIIDFEGPDIAIEDQPLELNLKVSYHDTLMQSETFNLGTVIPSLSESIIKAQIMKRQEDEAAAAESYERQKKILFFLITVGTLLILGLTYWIYLVTKRTLKTTQCKTCLTRVKKDHSNCPFRDKTVVARLVFLEGPKAGVTLPLYKGENRISVFNKAGLRLPLGKIKWWKHGQFTIDATRIIYTPYNLKLDKINGWPCTETRLLGQGYLLQLGVHKFRLEIKPSLEHGGY